MPSPSETLAAPDRATLLRVARQSIARGLQERAPAGVDPGRYPEPLRAERASFVTLMLDHRLRGCVGALEATRALVQDVAENAYRAAFRDPRFAPLTEQESAGLVLHVSVLGPREPLRAGSEEALVERLRPGIDGLVLRHGSRRATFLPAVWESIPDPNMFLTQLKFKAGLPLDFWSEQIIVERYTTESFGD